MAAEKPHSGGDEPAALSSGGPKIWRFTRPRRSSFSQTGSKGASLPLLAGLLGRVERKNSWQLAEQRGERRLQGVQCLLNAAHWDAGAVRDELRDYVVEHLGGEHSGVLMVDETGFSKKGETSVGVACQYMRAAGKRRRMLR